VVPGQQVLVDGTLTTTTALTPDSPLAATGGATLAVVEVASGDHTITVSNAASPATTTAPATTAPATTAPATTAPATTAPPTTAPPTTPDTTEPDTSDPSASATDTTA
jgi:hypothetical protein